MGLRRLIRENGHERAMAPVQMQRLEQAHRTGLVNDGFDSLNHELNYPLRDSGQARKRIDPSSPLKIAGGLLAFQLEWIASHSRKNQLPLVSRVPTALTLNVCYLGLTPTQFGTDPDAISKISEWRLS